MAATTVASMTVIRAAEDRDAAGSVALVREVSPLLVVTEETWLHRRRTLPARAQALSLVAEDDGEIVGRAEASWNWFADADTSAALWVAVRERRRRGLGDELYRRAEAHAVTLGARRLLARFDENVDGVRFAAARGFRELRAEAWSVVDPREVAVEPPIDVELLPVADVAPEEVHRVDDEATQDLPAAEPPAPIAFEEWLDHVWRFPPFSHRGSFAARVDGRVVAVTLLAVDAATGRALNMFTGTLRSHRGRGLALATKAASLRWAAANGVTQVVTTNDESNAPMLAVNRRLGYRPAGRRVEYARDL